MIERLQFLLNRIREHLWVRPLAMCLFSISLLAGAKLADFFGLDSVVPVIEVETIDTLLKILASSMLVIATFAVGSMVASYASASSTATPRSFSLVVADDVSQNALSSFVGAFIFSILALIARISELYGTGGRFVIFCLTLFMFALVVLTFVRWVDSIARLGRLGPTIDKIEAATRKSLARRRAAPTLGGLRAQGPPEGADPVYGTKVGYVLRLDMIRLQATAEDAGLRITLAVLPGAFLDPNRPIAFVAPDEDGSVTEDAVKRIVGAFTVGEARTFDEDPRFGLIVLSEIACRALSPAVNDPGTAIDIIGTMIRLFAGWCRPPDATEKVQCLYHRVAVPEIEAGDLVEDAFGAIARDGAGNLEVGIRLRKALGILAGLGDSAMRQAVERQARLALARAEKALPIEEDVESLRAVGRFPVETNLKILKK